MIKKKQYPGPLVFGLDIGTRNIVGTVGYKVAEEFYIIAQEVREHGTRAMLDGQIHDIEKVSETILEVKLALEEKIEDTLTDVCVAAAGRVLKTITTYAEFYLEEEKVITKSDIYELDSIGVEKSYEEFIGQNETDVKFYNVGYSVMHYYMNDYPMSNLEGHKAKKISADLIATFLPDDVVDGLNRAVELAGLEVINLTLEPIAAIHVAIPEMYRMLNIALVDVGAGTSDISITKDGSIVAYGMIPIAGDLLTDTLARHCLVDFATAETIKKQAETKKQIEYSDIMGISQTISAEELCTILDENLETMTRQVAEKIKELNGDKSVSAVFVVGGGGKFMGYTERLAKYLELSPERVGLRGEQVMNKIRFLDDTIQKDSLMVTPIGICLNFYENNNDFIYVTFNGKRLKLYDNNRLAIIDVAMQAGFANDSLFPKRGKELSFSVNQKGKIIRGEAGEAAIIYKNGELADIHTVVQGNDKIEIQESTAGIAANMEIGQLPEFNSSITVIMNGTKITLPKFASVNGMLQSAYYSIHEGDQIEMLNYYTVKQIADFMDVLVDPHWNLYVNNQLANWDTKVYENFTIQWTLEANIRIKEPAKKQPIRDEITHYLNQDMQEELYVATYEELEADDETYEELEVDDETYEELEVDDETYEKLEADDETYEYTSEDEETEEDDVYESTKISLPIGAQGSIDILVNGSPVHMEGKNNYIFVDVFDYIDFDLSKPQGKGIETIVNGTPAQYMMPIHHGDVMQIYWKV